MQCEWRHHLLQAHLVTQGFTQATSLNYNVTFAPMENFVSNHMVLALIAHNDWEVHQVDVKNLYLNARLSKMIYMGQLLGFTPHGSKGQVCWLFKALYHLKQVRHCWYHQKFARPSP